MLQFGLRLGRHPRCLVATTPRPTRLIRELLAREGRDVVVTRGSTYENRANLAPGFFDQVIRKYEDTRLGRQELNAELLEDTPGALWSHATIDAARQAAAPSLARIVVAIDPAASAGEEADETGILVVGRDTQGHGYVLADASGKHQPVEWAKIAIAAYRRIVSTASSPSATTAARWSRRRSAWSTTTSRSRRFGRAAGKSHVPSRSPRSMNRAGSTTSAPFPSWRTICARSRRISIGRAPATRRTVSMRWCGG